MDGGPEVELVSAAVAAKAVVGLLFQMDGEDSIGVGRAMRKGARTALLRAAARGGLEADPFEDVRHPDQRANGSVVDAGHRQVYFSGLCFWSGGFFARWTR